MNSISKRTYNLVLGGIMIAMATVLSFIAPFKLPYGVPSPCAPCCR